jgi:hypothetical protein
MKRIVVNQGERKLLSQYLSEQPEVCNALPLQVHEMRLYFRIAEFCLKRGQHNRAYAWIQNCEALMEEAARAGRLLYETAREYTVRRDVFDHAFAARLGMTIDQMRAVRSLAEIERRAR